MQQPSIGLLKTITAGFTERTVKPGSHISFTVQRRLGDQSWVVKMLGREVRVVSDLQLQVGARLRATVEFESGKLLLKIDHQSHAIKTLLQHSSLADTPQNRALLQAFMAQGLPIREAELKSARTLFSQLETQNTQTARLVALLVDKGLLLSAEQFRRLQSWVWGQEYSEQRGGQPEQQHSEQHSGQHSGQQGQQQRSHQETRESRLSKIVTEDVKEQLQSTSADASLLHLFNHRQARHDNWIIIPINFQSDDTGVLRLQLSSMGKPGRFTLTFHINSSESPAEWHFAGFCWAEQGKIDVYRGRHTSGRPDREILSKLQQKLNNLRFEIDDTIREASEFDPFGPGEGTAFKRVDTTA